MIDEKVLIERLEERMRMNEMFHNSIINNGIVVALGIINDLAEEHNNGWIPCSERLPKEKCEVLVTYKNVNEDVRVEPTTYEPKRKTFWCSPNVEAWQPLPAPYKKGE